MRFVAEGWEHPAAGGDDQPFVLEINAPSKRDAELATRQWLTRRGSAILDDFVVRKEGGEMVKKEAKKKPEQSEKGEILTRPCACGCGNDVKNTFAPGHDGRVHGMFLAVKRGDFLAEGLRTEELRAAYEKWDGTGSVRQAFH